MIDDINKMNNDETKQYVNPVSSFDRHVSISRPSIMKDTLTELDSYEGIMEKQSPSFHKSW